MDNKEQLVDVVLKSAHKGQTPGSQMRLACARAFELAKEFETLPAEIGRICNENDVKICKCQLGCFK